MKRKTNISKSPFDVVLKWITYFNQHDANGLATLYATNAVNDQVAEKPVKGKKRIQIMLEDTFYTFPDMTCIPINILQDGEWVALEWSGWSTMMKPIGKIKPTKKKSYQRGCGFFKIQKGKIVLQHGYWDKLSWYKQIGVKIEN